MKFQEFKNGNIRYTDPDKWYFEFSSEVKSYIYGCFMCGYESKSEIYIRDSHSRYHIEISCCKRCYFLVCFTYILGYIMPDPKAVIDKHYGII